MPGCDFISFEDARKASKQVERQQRLKENPIPVVVEVRGYRSTVRRELERRVAKEAAVAKKLGLEQIGIAWLPVKWAVTRPVFQVPQGMLRRDFAVKSVDGQMFLLRRWMSEFTLV
jgi:hypothetical protein